MLSIQLDGVLFLNNSNNDDDIDIGVYNISKSVVVYCHRYPVYEIEMYYNLRGYQTITLMNMICFSDFYFFFIL